MVVHGCDAAARQHAAADGSCGGQHLSAHHEESHGRGEDRGGHRKQNRRPVISRRERQLEGRHVQAFPGQTE